MSSPLLLIAIALMSLSLFMFLVWVVATVIKNSGIVDVAWALGFTVAAGLYVYFGNLTNARQWTIVSMVVLWSLRLTWHLAVRFKRLYPAEDPRYTALKAKMGSFANEKMLLVFLWQAGILALMTAPLAVAIADRRDQFSPAQFMAIALWLAALSGESLADYQLSLFTSQKANRGRTCQIGLWRYCRHPNYFFEWLGAVAFFVYAADSPFGICTIVCPLVLLYLLINVTGVKPSEEHSLRCRSDYADYKTRTSAFVPWFRRKTAHD